MKTKRLILVIASAGLSGALWSCAAAVPQELAEAREAYQRVSTGPAAQVAPAEVHVADKALSKAERSFEEDEGSYRTRDLAYVAQRKAQLAEAVASIRTEQQRRESAKDDFSTTQGRIVDRTKADLSRSKTALADSQRTAEESAARLATEKAARIAAEKDTASALAKLANVKDEARGMVITLSGSVLFASGQSRLLPEAKTRLDQVADVLLTTRERNLMVEGHTDSQGSDAANMKLSLARADSVREYLVQRGYGADLVTAAGLGEGRPLADNGSAEGRANNRRVEIIIARQPQASNP